MRKGTAIPCRRTEDRKGAGTNSGDSGTRNLEAESIRIIIIIMDISMAQDP